MMNVIVCVLCAVVHSLAVCKGVEAHNIMQHFQQQKIETVRQHHTKKPFLLFKLYAWVKAPCIHNELEQIISKPNITIENRVF